MSLLTAAALCKSFGDRVLLRDLSFAISAGDRVGLVGANGSGKTTLLRLLTGADDHYGGTLALTAGVRLGYLAQVPTAPPKGALRATMLEEFAALRAQEAELAALSERLAAPDCPPATLARYGELQAAFEHAGGYDYQRRVDTVLCGLGFAREQFDWPLAQFSGGWQTRASLARLLLSAPDVLLLDEPTNHLDLAAVRWLEDWLAGYRGSLLLVSHDRYFLDRVCTRIWELAAAHLTIYRGNYSDYLGKRAARRAEQQAQWEARQEEIAKVEDFVRRYGAGQRAREARGRQTKLERMLRDDPIARPVHEARLALRLEVRTESGETVLTARGLVFGYTPDRPLGQLPDLLLRRGQRLAIVGPNGCGKSTLLRTLVGQLPPLAGTVRPGTFLETGYLAQTHEELPPDATVLDTLARHKTAQTVAQLRHFLGALLFRGDDVFKLGRDLSGGERTRLALGCLALRRPNLLVLDEPTNHLDIPARELLEELLANYDGTVIFVTHDRYLVQAVATQLCVFDEGRLTCLEGNWEDYERERGRRAGGNSPAAAAAAPESAGAREHAARRRQRNEGRRQQQRFAAVETEIHTLEARRPTVELALTRAATAGAVADLQRLTAELRELEARLATLYEEWAALGEALEADG